MKTYALRIACDHWKCDQRIEIHFGERSADKIQDQYVSLAELATRQGWQAYGEHHYCPEHGKQGGK